MRSFIRLTLLSLLLTGCLSPSGDKHIESGSLLYLDGEYEKAETELRKALGKRLVRYSEKELFTILGNTYNELEEYDSSIAYHKKAVSLDSNYADAWVNLGIVYRLTSEFDLAEGCYARAAEINPENPELQTSLGALYIFKGDTERAMRHLEKAIQIDPEQEVARANYSLALAMTGNFEKADAELNKAVSLGYKNGDILREQIDELKNPEE